ncbi:hypothetical protein N8596_00680, partial [bacterium]|nr:hypothetical protein [bacterium]
LRQIKNEPWSIKPQRWDSSTALTTAESMSSSPTQPPLLVKIKRLQSADKALYWSCFAWLYTMCLLTLIEITLDVMSFDPHPRTTYFTLLEWPPCLFGLLAAIVAYRRSGGDHDECLGA